MIKNVMCIPITKMNKREKEEYINDMFNALYAHIRVNKDSTILDNFATHSDEIRRKYDFIVSGCEMQEKFDSFKNKYKESIKSSRDDEEKEKIFFEMMDEMQSHLEECILMTAEYSQLNALRELYEKNEKERRDKEEFLKSTNDNSILKEVALAIDKKRRMKYIEVKHEFNLSDMEMTKLLKDGCNYFNIAKEENHQIGSISLNSRGKRFIRCVVNDVTMIPQSKVDEIMVSNCESVVLSMKSSIIKKIPFDVNIVGVSPSCQRKIWHFHRQNLEELININSAIYDYKIVDNDQAADGGKLYGISKSGRFI